jgi:hypothetical protein
MSGKAAGVPQKIERLAAAVCERLKGVWGNIDFLRLPLRKAPHDDKRLMAVQVMSRALSRADEVIDALPRGPPESAGRQDVTWRIFL